MELILFYITAPLCVALIVAILVGYELTSRANNKAKTATAELAELKKKLKKEADSFQHTARQLSAYYDERVDREKKKIEEIEISHESWRGIAKYCIKALDRMHPGWLEKRLAGEPEHELILTPPPSTGVKRATPKPRASDNKPFGDQSPPTAPKSQTEPEDWS